MQVHRLNCYIIKRNYTASETLHSLPSYLPQSRSLVDVLSLRIFKIESLIFAFGIISVLLRELKQKKKKNLV